MWDLIESKVTDPRTLAFLLAAAGLAATLVALASPWLQTDTLSRRIKAVSTERERIRVRERERLRSAQTKSTLRVKPSGLVKQLVDTLKLSTWLSTETAKAQLAQAGYRGAGAEYVFLAFRLIAPIAFFLIAAVYSIFIVHWDRPLIVKIGAAVAAAYAGIKAPELFLRNTIAKRGKELERAYPNTLDLLLICVESGMSIELAVRKVSQEIGVESVAMAEEMALLAAEMSFLEERRTAFENLGTRTGLEFHSLVDHCSFAVRALRHAAWRSAARPCPGEPRPAHDRGGKEGRGSPPHPDGADDPLLPARPFRRDSESGRHPDQSLDLEGDGIVARPIIDIQVVGPGMATISSGFDELSATAGSYSGHYRPRRSGLFSVGVASES